VERQSQSVDVYRHEQVQIKPVESEGYAVDDEFVEGVSRRDGDDGSPRWPSDPS
jgi:hypothetical protein